jgi:agmatine deiminase
MMRALGADKVIWASGIAGKDITDYHIDALARFVNPGRVLIQLPDESRASDPWSVAAFETYNILKNARDGDGRKLELVVVPEPVDIRSSNLEFVASYVNFYVCNGAVIAAEFGDDAVDEQARTTLAQLYPGREIVMLNVDPIGEAGGGIHCATQQQPAATK